MKYAILIILLFIVTRAVAQLGNIDKDFGHDVLAETRFSSSYFDEITAIAIQPDGKILAAGYSRQSLDYLALARFTIDGNLDRSFGKEGKLMFNPNDYEQNVSLLLQKDGKIILAGSGSYLNSDSAGFFAARFDSNGTLDLAFGKNGRLSSMFPGIDPSIEEPICVAAMIQPDGKILLAGDTFLDDSQVYSDYINMTRYSADGKPDLSFGSSGILMTKTGFKHNDIRTMALEPDGSIVLGGAINGQIALLRYTSNGVPDSSFGSSGNSISDQAGIIKYISTLPDGKIITLSEHDNSNASDSVNYCISRYNVNGSIDRTFAEEGSTNLNKDYAQGSTLCALVILADGEMIGVGEPPYWSTTSFLIVHYTAEGIYEPGYNLSDFVVPPAEFVISDNSTLIQPDGKIVIGGQWHRNDVSLPTYIFGLKRFNVDGTLDYSFTSQPAIVRSNSFGDDIANTIALEPDRTILLGGNSEATTKSLIALMYDQTGSVSTWFADNGKLFSAPPYDGFAAYASAIKLKKGNLLAGELYIPQEQSINFGLLYGPNPITYSYTFYQYDFGGGKNNCRSLLLQPDGLAVMAGYAFTGKNFDFALLRYNVEAGSLDPTFGSNGKVTTDLQGNQDYAFGSALQTDGKIILAGTSYNNKQWQIALVRYNSDGSFDRSFGDTGVVLTSIHDSDDCAKAVQVQKDGKIVVAGFTYNANARNYDIVLLRYNTNGTLDSKFGRFGVVETPISSGDAKANGMVIQSDGKIIVAGYSSNGKDDDFTIACYNPNGSLDNKFGTGGITTTDYGFGDDHANAVALQSDGSIVVAGYAYNGTDKDYAVAKYLPDLSLGVIDRKSSQTISTIYPNPIHSSAKLEYELSKSQPVTIRLFDILGNERATFTKNEMRNAGKNIETINFPGRFAAGSYYLRIETSDGFVTVKVLYEP